MKIIKDDLQSTEIADLLNEHLEDMAKHSPPESIHALDISKLRQPNIAFWSLWEGEELLGCGALKELSAEHAEIKSMRTTTRHQGKGLGSLMLKHLLQEAENKNYIRISLETGSMDAFLPARKLYEKFGFSYCDPFADYKEDPNSVFMTKVILS